jgi:hypothetical protein
MARIIPSQSPEKFLPKFVEMTPYQIYLNQVKSAIEPIRFARQNMDYFPPQLGGLSGQRNTLTEAVVLQLIEFEIK